MTTENIRNDLDNLIGEHYIPSAIERKKSIMMYVIWGILLSLTQLKVTRYEQFHLKQAIGRRTLFFILLIPSIVLIFLPRVRVLPFIFYVLMIAIWIIFFMQSRKGECTSFGYKGPILPVFVGFGGWVLDVFNITLKYDDGEPQSGQQ